MPNADHRHRSGSAIPLSLLWVWVGALRCASPPTTISDAVASITLTPASAAIVVGQPESLTATVRNSAGVELPGRLIAWSTSESSVSTVSIFGIATGTGTGTATIRAMSEGKTGSATLTVGSGAPSAAQSVLALSQAFIANDSLKATVTVTVRNSFGGVIADATPAMLTVSVNPGVLSAFVCTAGVCAATYTGPGSGAAPAVDVGVNGSSVKGSPLEITSTYLVSGSITVGINHGCGLDGAGAAYCWGANNAGQIGSGRSARTPVPVAGGLRFTSLSAGGNSTCSLVAAGEAYCWGADQRTSPTGRLFVPTPIATGFTFERITQGQYTTCALTTGGAAYCWGVNTEGEVGDGTTTSRANPTAVLGGHTFSSLAAGLFHVCGLTPAGDAYCWGYNSYGQLGDSTTYQRPAPVAVRGGLRFGAISVQGAHTCALTEAGEAYCWGSNLTGELGVGDSVRRYVPTAVTGGLVFTAVTVGYGYTCGLTATGSAYCWGFNAYGQLGDGSSTDRLVPTPVAGGLRFTSLVASQARVTCGVSTLGPTFCWGSNINGAVGDGTLTDRPTPTEVRFP